ncbi:hypothetical protein HN358_00805 [Candidatus Uhrbacteria bacterium]|jgi:hypothetical protein|nr:hypothetical protein [Candidatus Uhrbacteria bacterium]MBT7717425.1 hypothetical protein [Candidatus Uhrbacteria bacterium]
MRKLVMFIFLSLLFPAQVFAFDPNYLISDWDFTDPFALDFNQIQHYLNRGFLGDYLTEDWEGDDTYATNIIWETAQTRGISPKVLLVMLQKEQSLVEDDDPSDSQLDWAMGYAVCDDCSKQDEAIQRWKGFGKQVNSAAMQLSEGYLEDIDNYGTTQGVYGPGVDVEIDDTTVTPINAATAALYAYTPHLHGNENFVTIWDRWFSTNYPTGSLLQAAGESGVYYIEYGFKRPINSWSALLSRFNSDLIIEVNPETLDNYSDGRAIDFPNYSLLHDDDENIYLLVDDSLRPFDSVDSFYTLGFKDDELNEIDSDDVELYEQGATITASTASVTGELVQLSTNDAYYYLQGGLRHAVLTQDIALARFGLSSRIIEPVEVEQYAEAAHLLIPDGYLIKTTTDPTVYVIAEGERLPIGSESIFNSFGWQWNDIIDVSDETLALHRLGDAIE